jgi:hypothetical protein
LSYLWFIMSHMGAAALKIGRLPFRSAATPKLS